MKKRVFSIFVIAAMLCSILPVSMVSAKYTTTVSPNAVLFYSEDFSDFNAFDTAAAHSMSKIEDTNNYYYAVEGGWDLSSSYSTSTRNGTNCLHPAWGNGCTSTSGTNSSTEWHLPQEWVYRSGTYTFRFDYWRGSKVSESHFMLGSSNSASTAPYAYDSGSAADMGNMCSTNNIGKALNSRVWYTIEIVCDMTNKDGSNARITVYDKDNGGTLYHQYTKANNKSQITYISFRSQVNVSQELDDSNGEIIDNLEVYYTPTSSYNTTSVHGNIYSSGFDTPVANATDAVTNGGWELSEKAGYRKGSSEYAAGDKALQPSYSIYKTAGKGDNTSYSTYYVGEKKGAGSGVYDIKFDYYRGDNTNNNYVFFCDNSFVLSNRDSYNSVEFSGTCARQSWYNFNIIIDMDAGTIRYIISGNGANLDTTEAFNGTKLSGITFLSLPANSKQAKNNLSQIYDSAIDNLEINHYEQNLIYNENFSGTISSGGTAAAGGWSLSGSGGKITGEGFDGDTNSFAITKKPGQSVSGSGDGGSSEYFIPPANVSSMGQYRIQYKYYQGNNTKTAPLSFGVGEWNDSNIATIAELGSLQKGKWYDVDIVADLDLHICNVRVTDESGSNVIEATPEYNFAKISYISFRATCNSAKTQAAGDASLIDNLMIKKYDAPTMNPLSAGSTSITQTVNVVNHLWNNNKPYYIIIAKYSDNNFSQLVSVASEEFTAYKNALYATNKSHSMGISSGDKYFRGMIWTDLTNRIEPLSINTQLTR